MTFFNPQSFTQISQLIDHTLLKPQSTATEIKNLCQAATKYQFATVCTHSCWTSLCSKLLKNTSTGICTVIGFPLGATSTPSKVYETKVAIQDGATEIDMVISIGHLKANQHEYVLSDISEVKSICNTVPLKVIIETCLLTENEKVLACQLAEKAGADYVKTSTGFSTGGATISDIKLMKETVEDRLGIKASGGIKDLDTLIQMVDAGATRIGTSSGIDIINAYKRLSSK